MKMWFIRMEKITKKKKSFVGFKIKANKVCITTEVSGRPSCYIWAQSIPCHDRVNTNVAWLFHFANDQ